MASFNVQLLGSNQIAGRTWAPIPILSTTDAPAEELQLDPTLPPLGSDPLNLSFAQIVVPKGRLVSIVRNAASTTGKSYVTVANGLTNKPVGYAPYNLMRQPATGPIQQVAFKKNDYLELPWVSGVNDANGTALPGDYIMAYSGSATSTTKTPEHVGKMVKWVEKEVLAQTLASPSATATLTAATNAGFIPTIVCALNASGVPVSGASAALPTAVWNGTNHHAIFASAVKTVIYTLGASVEQRAGQLVRIQPVDDLPGWLSKVMDDFGAWDIPPMFMRVPTSAVSNEVVTLTANVGTLANKPIAGWKTITVTITGSVEDIDGTTTVATGAELARADVADGNWCHGQYYDINPVTGVIRISSNVTVTRMTVSYSYQHAYLQGRDWFPGIQGITDGSATGVVGTPAHLNYAGLIGAARVMIF